MSMALVTGGAGFIGSNLTEALLQRGHSVRVLDDFSTGKRENLTFHQRYPSLEILEGDIRNLSTCRKAVEGMEYIFHQGALPSVQRSVEDPETSHAVNAGGTLNILLAAREKGVKRVMYAASSSVYGDTPTLPKHEDMPPNPLSPYALQKYVGEQYCRLFTSFMALKPFPSGILISLAQSRTRILFTLPSSLNLSMPSFRSVPRSFSETESSLEILRILRMWSRLIFSPCLRATSTEKPLILPAEKESR